MGVVHGYGVGSRDDVDISAPLGTFGNTGGHRQDIDSAGAYVVAGPDGDDVSHALGAANPNRHDPSFQTYIGVPADEEAVPLSHGSNPNSNAAGRRREDDHNLVAETFESRFARNGRGAPDDVVAPLKAQSGSTGKGDSAPMAMVFTKTHGAQDTEDAELWAEAEAARTLEGTGYAVDVVVEDTPQAYQVAPESGNGADLVVRETDVAPALGSKNEGPGYDRGVRIVHPITPDAASGRSGDADNATVDAAGRVRKRPPSLGVGDDGDPSFSMTSSTPPAVFETDVDQVGALTGGETPNGPRGGPQRLDPHAVNSGQFARAGSAVRRLTPEECERLQGFPGGWTFLEPATPDGPRYAALGDAVTVNVPQWIVSRLVRKWRACAGG